MTKPHSCTDSRVRWLLGRNRRRSVAGPRSTLCGSASPPEGVGGSPASRRSVAPGDHDQVFRTSSEPVRLQLASKGGHGFHDGRSRSPAMSSAASSTLDHDARQRLLGPERVLLPNCQPAGTCAPRCCALVRGLVESRGSPGVVSLRSGAQRSSRVTGSPRVRAQAVCACGPPKLSRVRTRWAVRVARDACPRDAGPQPWRAT